MNLSKIKSKKVLLTHADRPNAVIGYETRTIESNPNTPLASEIIVNMSQEGDFAILLRCYNSGAKVSYKINNTVTEFNGDYNDILGNFCRPKHKTEMTLDKCRAWFRKNYHQFGTVANVIQTALNMCRNTEELESTYRNVCTALEYDIKPFATKTSDIEEYNNRTHNAFDNRNDREYYGDGLYKTYNYHGEYEEQPQHERVIRERQLSSYSSKCKETYNIITEKELCTTLGYIQYLDDLELPENIYKCKCGAYTKYRTVDCFFDNNNGIFRTYPDRDVCCPHCGALRLAR